MSMKSIRPKGAEGTSHLCNVAKPPLTVNESSMSAPIDTQHFVFGPSITKEAGHRKVLPFVSFAEDAHAASAGIESLVGLLRCSMMNPDSDDLKLSAYDTDNLLGLVQFTAWALHSKCSDLQRWANEHLTAGGAE